MHKGCELVVEELAHFGRHDARKIWDKPSPPSGTTSNILCPACFKAKSLSLCSKSTCVQANGELLVVAEHQLTLTGTPCSRRHMRNDPLPELLRPGAAPDHFKIDEAEPCLISALVDPHGITRVTIPLDYSPRP